jgi:hypothetical protein
MSSAAETDMFAEYMGSAFILAAWLGVAVGILFWVNDRVKRVAAGWPADKTYEPGSVRFVLYAAGLCFWPLALLMAFIYLGKPESARTGRGLVCVALAHGTFIVLLSIAIAVWLSREHPELVR